MSCLFFFSLRVDRTTSYVNEHEKKRHPQQFRSSFFVFFPYFSCFFLEVAEAKAKDMQLNINMAMLINADFTANLGDPMTSVTTSEGRKESPDDVKTD